MSKVRFPQNWATAELIKQYMRNHRRYEVRKSRMMPRHHHPSAASSGNTSQLPNIDSDSDKDKTIISIGSIAITVTGIGF